MKKVITITDNGRWNYLERLLEDLLLNDLEGWSIAIQCEPSGSQSNSYAAGMLKNRDHNLASFDVRINDQRLGVKGNPYNLLERVFSDGADYVLYLENDLSVSADVTLLADWYAKARSGWRWGSGDPSRVQLEPGTEDICCRLFHTRGGAAGEEDEIYISQSFSSLGFILDRSQWRKHFEPEWDKGGRGWDWAMQDYIDASDGKRFVCASATGRSNHTGREGGTHCPPELHDERYGDIRPYWGGKVIEYRFTGRPAE